MAERDFTAHQDSDAAKGQQTSPWIAGGGLLVIASMLYWVMSMPETADATRGMPEAPSLWNDSIPACPEDGQRAQHTADRTAKAADAKQERFPFAVRDGIKAVRLYRIAAVCFALLEDDARREAASDAAQRLKERIDRRYQGHLLRMRLALEQNDHDNALREARAIRALMTHLPRSPYVEWLTQMIRRLERAG